CARKQDSLDVW
nr:immunoglobulin heavy chain junction region [Macaca mulatta]MOV38069.1 immunoglobulin heavy chain junction region [Macaca mulatta]MOV38767.1 immunoglobulin heavy chain junction region [Macaca mulatta]MOV38789.1 immunoglobulin heavy chain junction region [Macaca mulatta]MOV39544.1 immunoglobulin heavy chain junction region [Macaca mulatta]